MPRKHKELHATPMLHVVSRGVDRQDVFERPSDRAIFERRLDDAFRKHQVELLAYAWMTNHVHALVRNRDGDVSAAIGETLGLYARHFNAITDRVGPLWEPRFWATPIESDAQLLRTVRYIHRNPLEITGTSKLVEYPYSSFAVYTGERRAPAMLCTDPLERLLDPVRHRKRVLRPQRGDRLPFAFLPPQTTTSLDEIRLAVESVVDAVPTTRLPTRLVTILLAVELRAGTTAEIAAALAIDEGTVRNKAHLARRRLARDPRFQILRRQVFESLPVR